MSSASHFRRVVPSYVERSLRGDQSFHSALSLNPYLTFQIGHPLRYQRDDRGEAMEDRMDLFDLLFIDING